MRSRRSVAGLLLVMFLLPPAVWPEGGAVNDVPGPWEPPSGGDDPRPHPPYGAADLAADCNDDGLVEVTHDLEVHHGTGTLEGDCRILIADQATLTLQHVALTGSQGLDIQGGAGSGLSVQDARVAVGGLFNFESGDLGRLGIRRSELLTLPGGAINLSPGGRASTAAIDSSVIRAGGDLLLTASLYASGGRLAVRGSTLHSGAGPLDGVALYVSLSGVEGEVEVRDSSLVATERIEIVSGDSGRTAVVLNTFETTGPALIAAGAHGVCESRGNTPPVACTRE